VVVAPIPRPTVSTIVVAVAAQLEELIELALDGAASVSLK
jgi:hypothetical protein